MNCCAWNLEPGTSNHKGACMESRPRKTTPCASSRRCQAAPSLRLIGRCKNRLGGRLAISSTNIWRVPVFCSDALFQPPHGVNQSPFKFISLANPSAVGSDQTSLPKSTPSISPVAPRSMAQKWNSRHFTENQGLPYLGQLIPCSARLVPCSPP